MQFSRIVSSAFAVLSVAFLAAGASASETGLAGKTFHFGTHDARTNITFTSEADLETIHGHTNKVAGSVRVDADNKASGTIRVGVRTLDTGIDLRNQHLQGDSWLDAGRHPWITLELSEAVLAADRRTWTYKGRFTVKGVTREVTGTARVRHIPHAIARQARLGEGEWVRVRVKFDVKLSDYGIEIPQGLGPKVSDVWSVSIDMYGTSQPPPRR